jgi:hypothetical protein
MLEIVVCAMLEIVACAMLEMGCTFSWEQA